MRTGERGPLHRQCDGISERRRRYAMPDPYLIGHTKHGGQLTDTTPTREVLNHPEFIEVG
jgi:hypothetical protein